jgi:hypothetical protein
MNVFVIHYFSVLVQKIAIEVACIFNDQSVVNFVNTLVFANQLVNQNSDEEENMLEH